MVVDLLNISEVAAALRVSKMTIYRLIHANRLPAIQVGNSFRVHRSDLGVYLSSVFRGPFVKAEEVGSSGPMSSPSDF